MTHIDPKEEVLRLKRHIAVDLVDRTLFSYDDKERTKENIWEIFEYFYNKLTKGEE